jgi:hypothetical protein
LEVVEIKTIPYVPLSHPFILADRGPGGEAARVSKLAEALSRVVPDADCRVIYEFATHRTVRLKFDRTAMSVICVSSVSRQNENGPSRYSVRVSGW